MEYEDPIFVFVNIYGSQSFCKEENKVSNSTPSMLKISLIFCAVLTQPKWPEILECWERPAPLPVGSIRGCYTPATGRLLVGGANSRHPWLEDFSFWSCHSEIWWERGWKLACAEHFIVKGLQLQMDTFPINRSDKPKPKSIFLNIAPLISVIWLWGDVVFHVDKQTHPFCVTLKRYN